MMICICTLIHSDFLLCDKWDLAKQCNKSHDYKYGVSMYQFIWFGNSVLVRNAS